MNSRILLFLLFFSQTVCADNLIQTLKCRFQEMNQFLFYNDKEANHLVSAISEKGNVGDLVLRELYYSTYQDKQEIEFYKSSMLPSGLWPDLDYTDNGLGTWQPIRHADRLLFLSREYRNIHSSYYKNKEFSTVIHRGMQAWIRESPVCNNWWFNEIGAPRSLGLVFLNMLDELSPEELKGAINVMDHASFRMTGQNKVWLAGNVLIKAIIENNEELAIQARDTIASEIFTTINEGIQPDFSFHQHGPQQQFGNYGLAYVTSMAFYAALFNSTKIEFSPTQMDVLRNYILDGQQWIIWKGMMDHNACGRQLVKDAQVGKALGLFVSVYQMSSVDSKYTNNYNSFLRNNVGKLSFNQLVGSKHFWRSDLSVYRSNDSYISVRACSPRVIGTEFTNNENRKGHFLADGNTLIYRTGKEYENIIPVWNWNKLPGVTAPYAEDTHKHKGDDYRNKNAFVGGVTLGNYGLTAFHLDRNNIDFKKAYFYFNKILVCLGADLKSSVDKDIITDINQTWKKGEVIINSDKKTQTLNDTAFTGNKLNWIWHDSIGYCILSPTRVSVSTKIQSGNWNETTDSYGSKPVKGTVFDLWINHGNISSRNSYYAYAILPSVSSTETKQFFEHPILQILFNNEDLQAIEDVKTNTLEAIFHKNGQVITKSNLIISSKNAGLIILKQSKSGELTISVADPTQLLHFFDISVCGKYEGDSTDYDPTNKVTNIHIPLPQNGLAGSTLTVKIYPSKK